MAPTTSTTKKAPAVKKVASHPTFLAMVQEAVKAHPEEARQGVSRPTIKKYLATQYKIDLSSASNINNLSNAIKRGHDTGALLLPKGIGGRVKLPAKKPAAGKENAPPKPKVVKAKKPAAPKAAVTKKPAAPKVAAPKAAAKPAVKKAAPTVKKTAAKKTSAPKKAPAAKAAAKAAPKKAVAPKKKVVAAAKK